MSTQHTQPEALRLADELSVGDFDFTTNNEAAAELRRLHELNGELLDALERIASFTMSQFMGPHDMALECVTVARAAVAKETNFQG